jgi:hypothetical protein
MIWSLSHNDWFLAASAAFLSSLSATKSRLSRSIKSKIRNLKSKFFQDMASPARLVFTPFVVVVGCKCFLPVPGGLLFNYDFRIKN